MGTQKAQRNSSSNRSTKKAVIKVESPDPSSENVSSGALRTVKARQARQAKREITKGAVEKSNRNAENTMASIAMPSTAVDMQDDSVQDADLNKPDPSNGRVLGRKLIRWSPTLDQILLLHMEYELKRRGIEIPFQSIANRFSGEKNTSGSSIQQHLAKLRLQLLDRGAWVPPLPGRSSNKKDDVRGVVRCMDNDGQEYERVVQWDEDTSLIFDQLENEVSNYRKRKMSNIQKSAAGTSSIGNETGSPSAASHARGSNNGENSEVDPSELLSDADYEPSATRSKTKTKRKKIYQAAKVNDNYSSGDEQVEERVTRMMTFDDDEVEHVDRKVVIFRTSPNYLAQYPTGISGNGDDLYDPHDTVQAMPQLIDESEEEDGEEVADNFSDDDPGNDGNGEVEDEAFANMNTPISMPLKDLADSNYEPNVYPPVDANTGYGVSQGEYAHQAPPLYGPSSLNPMMQWTDQTMGSANSFNDAPAAAFDPNMYIDPAFMTNYPMNLSDFPVDLPDGLSYGSNSSGAFQNANLNTNTAWNQNTNMKVASNIANTNDFPADPEIGYMCGYSPPSDGGMFPNFDARGASMSQDHDEHRQSSTDNFVSGSHTTQPTNPVVSFADFLNEDIVFDWHEFERCLH